MSIHKCSKCFESKPSNEFYSHWRKDRQQMRVDSKCKSCAKKYKPGHAKNVRKSELRYPKKQKNRALIQRMIKKGELIRPNICVKCSSIRFVYAHHPDHRKPKFIVWLCSVCHTAEHRMAA